MFLPAFLDIHLCEQWKLDGSTNLEEMDEVWLMLTKYIAHGDNN